MPKTPVRLLLLLEAASLGVAALLHTGYLTGGPFDTAAYYESAIAIVLLIGLAVTYAWPGATRWTALVVQAFALAGASIGLYLAIRGIGPNTMPDMVFHVALVVVLIGGLAVAWRSSPDRPASAA
jgi:hypothetical protein